MNKKFSLLAMTLLASSLAWGQSKVSPYSAHYMRSHNVVAHSGDESGQVVSAYLHTTGTPNIEVLEKLGVKVNLRLDGILTVRLPLSVVPELEKLDFVKYIQFGTPVRPMLDSARVSAGVDKVQNGDGFTMPYTGKDVVIGIIDGGFDYTHPAFRDKDGNLRIKRVWEQCHEGGTPPEGFSYGSEFADEEKILAIGGDVKTNSHGTHVANIAAGASHMAETPYYGVAPESEIVLVSNRYASGDTLVLVTPDNVNISDAIAYIYGYAESVGKPCVINMSLGNHLGPHDGTSTFDQVADQLQGEGRLLVGSVGNYGATRMHVSKSFTGAEDSPLKFMIQKKESLEWSNTSGATVEVWGEAGMTFDLNLVVLSTVGSQYKENVTTSVLTVGEGETVTQELDLTDKKSCVGKVLVSTEVSPLNGRPHALLTFHIEKATNRVVGIVLTPRTAGTVHAWAEGSTLLFAETSQEGWTSGDTSQSLTEIGGTGKRIISVGAYVSKNVYKTEGSNRDNTLEGETLYARGTFSSAGPTLDGRVKPDVMAPGTYVASAISSHDSYASSYPTAQNVVWNEDAYTYSYMQGTSMAAPFVTGVLATWLQANPSLTPEVVREVISATAINDEYTFTATCGYGKVDAYHGLKEVITRAEGVETLSAGKSESICLLSRSGDAVVRMLFTKALPASEVAVYDAIGTRVLTHQISSVQAGDEVEISLVSLPRGIYLLQVGGEVHKIARFK